MTGKLPKKWKMRRKFNGFVPVDARTIFTCELTRGELAFLFDRIRRCCDVKETRMELRAMKERRRGKDRPES